MVFFTCGGCGESLKKNRVEKHVRGPCRRNSPTLTCVDCLKEFSGESYAGHVTCMTEAERYGGKGWQPKANANKGLKKQTAWVDGLKQFLEKSGSIDPDVRAVVDLIVGYDNIPQKKPKFMNFAKNVCGRRFPPATLERTWHTIEAACKWKPETDNNKDQGQDEAGGDASQAPKESEKGKKAEAEDEDNDEKENGVRRGLVMFSGTAALAGSNSHGPQKDKKKRKKDTAGEEDVQEEPEPKKANKEGKAKAKDKKKAAAGKGRFDFEGVVLELLTKKNKGEGPVKLNRIRKKVVSAYLSDSSLPLKGELEVAAKLEKHLSKNKKFVLKKDSVCLAKNM